MTEKKIAIALYIIAGFLIAGWPIGWLLGRGTARFGLKAPAEFSRLARLSFAVLGATAVFGWAFGPVYALPAGLFLAYIAYSNRNEQLESRNLVGAALGLAVSATLPWWRHLPATPTIVYVSWGEAIYFLTVLIFIHHTFIRLPSSRTSHPSSIGRWVLPAVFVVIVALISFTTGIYLNAIALDTVWHHWGAYIAPSELLLAGARIFHDFPAQYGLGPTLLIAAACGSDCWSGMYFLVGGSLLGFAVLLSLICLRVARDHFAGHAATAIVLLAVLLCAFFWNSYPPLTSSPATTPSTNGLRFLPVLALTALLLFRYTATERTTYWQAHVAWVVGALWSPESAFMCSLLWWPTYIWLRCSGSPESELIRTIFRSTLTLALVAAATVAAFLSTYWVAYRALPTLRGFLAYLINPPGILPISSTGPLWFFAGGLIAGCYALYKTSRTAGDGPEFRERFILILLAYGTLSYFLGRSHDNNILNILAFIMPLLLSLLKASASMYVRTGAVVMFGALVGWSGIFGWSAWQATAATGRLLELDPDRLLASLSYENPETADAMRTRYLGSKIPLGNFSDASRAIASISTTHRGEPVTALNITLNMVRGEGNSVWSAIHNPANYNYMPSEYRQEFIANTARVLQRPGWMLMDRQFPHVELVNDLNSGYVVTQILEFGDYYATRYEPKANQ